MQGFSKTVVFAFILATSVVIRDSMSEAARKSRPRHHPGRRRFLRPHHRLGQPFSPNSLIYLADKFFCHHGSLTSSLTTSLSAAGQSAIEFKDVRLGFDEGEILGGVTSPAQERELNPPRRNRHRQTLWLKLASGLLRPDSGSISGSRQGHLGNARI